MNHKDERIRKLWNLGIKNPAKIAKKIGYGIPNILEGIKRVEEGLERMELITKQ